MPHRDARRRKGIRKGLPAGLGTCRLVDRLNAFDRLAMDGAAEALALLDDLDDVAGTCDLGRRRKPGRAAADDDDIGLNHGWPSSASTFIPALAGVMHASRTTPSTRSRQHWQAPMPQK